MLNTKKDQTRPFRLRLYPLWATVSVVMAVSLACNLPFTKEKPEPLQPTQTQVSKAADLPPTIVETNPLPRSTLALQGTIELTFDQPMERSSVEGAFGTSPAYSGSFEWEDDARVRFTPDQPLPANTTLTITVGETARSANGMRLQRAQEFSYHTAGELKIAEYFPSNGLNQVDPASSVAVTFNQPVAPIGDSGGAPLAFTIQPDVSGSGKWLNSSTYLFEPEVSLGGGVRYTVRINPELTSLAGSPLADRQDLDWSFQTSRPEIMWVGLEPGSTIWLEPEIGMQFNQAMDRASVEANVHLVNIDGEAYSLAFTWEEGDTRVTIKTKSVLPRGKTVTLRVDPGAKSYGGTEVGTRYDYAYQTLTSLAVSRVNSEPGQEIHTYRGYGAIDFSFNAPLAKGQNIEELVSIDPAPDDFSIRESTYQNGDWFYISGFFQASQNYTVTISAELTDKWGGQLEQPYTKTFHVADLESNLEIPIISAASRVVFLLPGEQAVQATGTNLSSLEIRSARQTIQELLQSYLDYEEKLIFTPDQTWNQTVNAAENRTQTIDIGLTADGSKLETGIYRFLITSPQVSTKWQQPNFWLVVSNIQMTMKTSKGQVFVWATDLQTKKPVAGKQITVYDDLSNAIGSGVTDSSGIATINYIPGEKYKNILAAVMGEPGSPDFSAGFSLWRYGIQTYDYGLPTAGYLPDLDIYGYTDRPIYRPGQTVYFRGVLRQPLDARYGLTDLENEKVEVYGDYNNETGTRPLVTTLQLPVSPYGTINGEFVLSEDSVPGDYEIRLKRDDIWMSSFKVAEYRKPQIDLKVSFDQAEYKRGGEIRVNIDSAYFYGSPAAGSKIIWTLYARSDYFSLPEGYITGPLDLTWMQAWHWSRYDPMGKWVTNGEGIADSNGRLSLTFTPEQLADALVDVGGVTLTLEATLMDQSGMVLSQRDSAKLHPSDFYVGVRPDNWGQSAGTSLGYSVQTTDWDKQPSGEHVLKATFQKVDWKLDEASLRLGDPKYIKELTPVSGSMFKTDAAGLARIEFIPQDPGTYQVEITGEGALTQLIVWVGGSGTAIWPRLPNQHLRIEADKQQYEPGDTAKIFIPNPFENGALALVTVERSSVLRSQVIEINGPSQTIDLPMNVEDAPNVYISVMLLGKGEGDRPDFRLGFVQVGVNPEFLKLQVDLIPETSALAPGETARAQLRVRDYKGNPVKGEFSLAVVDKAIFALADSNAQAIPEAYYGIQYLRVITSTSLVAFSERMMIEQPAMGGGGGGTPSPVAVMRKNFRDTAYWNATIETDENGTAQIEFPVPDNLTTWVMTARGLTADTLVGETTVNIVVSKDLLIQPVTPRFLVAGDRVQLGAVVHNNTDKAFDVKVELQAKGAQLEDPNSSEQTLQMQAHSNQRVEWWATVSNAGAAELAFSASGGGLQDAATPEAGDLPILHYSSPMVFAANGVMSEGGETLEVVSLPKSFTPTGGQLSIEMSSTLAGTVLSGLEAMKSFPFNFTEPILSNLSANLAVYEVLQVEGAGSPDLEAQLQKEIRESLDRLWNIQNEDGGWGWSSGQNSDFYLSAYALLAVSRAQKANFFVETEAFTKAQSHVVNALYSPTNFNVSDWELDRLALAYYALRSSGYEIIPTAPLYELRPRLSPWAQALLAMSMGEGDAAKVNQLLSDLQSTAIRSSTGANWEDKSDIWFNHASANTTTAIVLLALAEKDPASQLLTEATRYLSLHRRINGGWECSFDTSWAIQALARVLQVTGDLRGNFAFSASINGAPLASGQASGIENLNPVRASIGIENLDENRGNALRFKREEGAGRLYYRAFLQVDAPVEDAPATDKGITISRRYSLTGVGCTVETCPQIQSVSLGQFSPVVQVQLSITVPHDMYDLVVEDFIPAGSEIIDTELLSSQRGVPQFSGFDAEPVSLLSGWGWWFFGDPTIYDDHIRWVANSLPAGTYILTYDLQTLQAGEFRVLPAHAYAYYFPEVEGRSQGEIFTITN